MPVISGFYDWSEKSDTITVTIPLKGVSPSAVDIMATSGTLKVNYAPFLVDLVLRGEIDPNQHKAKVKDGNLVVTLKKTVVGKWGSLVCSDDDADAFREKSLQDFTKAEAEQNERRKDRRIADERYALKKQMNLDEGERNRLDLLKQEEKEQAEGEVYETFARLQKENSSFASEKDAKTLTHQQSKSSTISNIAQKTDIFSDNDLSDDLAKEILDESPLHTPPPSPVKQAKNIVSDDLENLRYVPPPRSFPTTSNGESGVVEVNGSTAKVSVSFTPRVFPTPMRESTNQQETDWIAKNRKHLKKHGVLGTNYASAQGRDISEQDPTWLKAKGDEYCRNNDYYSAINAYSSALDMDENMTACLSNRSICYLAVGMYTDCIEDCESAVAQIKGSHEDPNSLNLTYYNMLVKLCVRAGSAKCYLGLFGEAVTWYLQALKNQENVISFIPENENKAAVALKADLEKDIDKLMVIEQAEVMKQKGDKSMSEGNLQEALVNYTKSLEIVPIYVSCLSNRSACRLALGDIDGCVSDCTDAMALLQFESNGRGSNEIMLGHSAKSVAFQSSMLSAIIPPENSSKRAQWLLKTVVRRGAAHFQANRLDEAVADYGLAVSLDQKNEDLKKDLTKISNLRAARAQAK